MNQDSFASLKAFADLIGLRHLRERAKREYGRRVHLLGDHFQCDPATLSEAHVTEYFVFLIRDKGLAPASIRQARTAIELFFQAIVRVDWTVFSTIRTSGTTKLPTDTRAKSEEALQVSRPQPSPNQTSAQGKWEH
jgi:hypothetical protein